MRVHACVCECACVNYYNTPKLYYVIIRVYRRFYWTNLLRCVAFSKDLDTRRPTGCAAQHYTPFRRRPYIIIIQSSCYIIIIVVYKSASTSLKTWNVRSTILSSNGNILLCKTPYPWGLGGLTSSISYNINIQQQCDLLNGPKSYVQSIHLQHVYKLEIHMLSVRVDSHYDSLLGIILPVSRPLLQYLRQLFLYQIMSLRPLFSTSSAGSGG